ANVKMYFNKAGGAWVPTGSLEFMFSRKAVFEFQKKDGMNIEDLELELIDAGLEEIEENEGIIYASGDYTNFGTLMQALESLKIEITKANLQRIPNTPVEFTEEQLVDIEKMIDKIEDDDDIQSVFTNIA
ncbi:MAG: YebC/PmpR family DNA-binding transcriptional regulator, partial [Bacteroidota bacterium]|nr:YebC/PmpR family DNA-binding transcriptional regulator [Bacteroidota bacterium]